MASISSMNLVAACRAATSRQPMLSKSQAGRAIERSWPRLLFSQAIGRHQVPIVRRLRSYVRRIEIDFLLVREEREVERSHLRAEHEMCRDCTSEAGIEH